MTRASGKMAFRKGQTYVHDIHGTGIITDITEEEVAGIKGKFLNLSFEGHGLSVKIPLEKAPDQLRALDDGSGMQVVTETLKTQRKNQGGMWRIREKRFREKINSGNLMLIAEVLRDLYSDNRENTSYSAVQLLQVAVSKIATELAGATKKSETEVLSIIGKDAGMDLLSFHSSTVLSLPSAKINTGGGRPGKAKTEAPKTEAPKTEAPKTEAPKTEAPKTEAPKTEAPKTEAPKTSDDGGTTIADVNPNELDRLQAEVTELRSALKEEAENIVAAREQARRALEAEAEAASQLELTKAELRSAQEKLTEAMAANEDKDESIRTLRESLKTQVATSESLAAKVFELEETLKRSPDELAGQAKMLKKNGGDSPPRTKTRKPRTATSDLSPTGELPKGAKRRRGDYIEY